MVKADQNGTCLLHDTLPILVVSSRIMILLYDLRSFRSLIKDYGSTIHPCRHVWADGRNTTGQPFHYIFFLLIENATTSLS